MRSTHIYEGIISEIIFQLPFAFLHGQL